METEKKAYDIKVLAEQLKAKGLDLAEEALVLVVEELFTWVEESATISESIYDDMGLLVLPQLKKMALEQVDKIDGEKDQE